MTTDPHPAREAVAAARRVVVKIGSRSLVGASLHEGAMSGGGRFGDFADQVASAREAGRAFVVVSSGAVALGRGALGFTARPKGVAELQACAAVGQSRLMRGWADALGRHGIDVGQMLLSHDDLEDRERYLNARSALDALLTLDAVPVVNENDTVAVDEIRFGDNDQLAAMVCTLADADLLVLLTDVEGLLDETGSRVAVMRDLAHARTLVEAPQEDIGSGGMGSKLDAAARASRRGVPVVIADAREPAILAQVLGGQDVGTLVPAGGARIASRKHWIAYTLRARGALLLDAGAVRALRDGGRSLLPAGVVGVRGSFRPGDAVVLRGPEGAEVARGLTRYGTEDVAKLAGARTDEIRSRLGYHGGDVVVHRDDLALTG